MKILAVDTSCDDSCAAIIDTKEWKLLAEKVISHLAPMQKFGGVVPELASREHLKALPLAVESCLKEAGLTLQDIDWFGVTHRPGLIGSLLVGVSYVKALAFATQKPFSVFNHIEAHLFSPFLATLEKEEIPSFPWVALVVSGGHTELFSVQSLTDYQWLGGTLDDAAGEAFDKVGKLLGLEYPAGPVIDRLAREKATDCDRTLPFPRSKVEGPHFSFSGLKTAVALFIQKSGVNTEPEKIKVLASAQEAILDSLIEKTRTAASQIGGARIVVTGGVACNSRLRERLGEAYFPKKQHCTDNAAMVAVLAGLKERAGTLTPASWDVTAHSTGDF